MFVCVLLPKELSCVCHQLSAARLYLNSFIMSKMMGNNYIVNLFYIALQLRVLIHVHVLFHALCNTSD